MIGKIKMMAIITFYVAVLLVIAVYLQDGSGTFSHFFENANLYIRNLRNVHAPAFHQTYDNYLQLFPLILLFGLKLGGIRGNFGWKRLFTFIVLSVVLTQLVVNGLKLTTGRGASPGCHKLFLFSFRTYGSSVYGSYPIV